MPRTTDHAKFIELLTARFPHIAAGIDDCCQGLLHPEMGSFARATRAAIERGDFATVERHIALAAEVFATATPEVENAIYVSYLENIWCYRSDPDYNRARAMLPPSLANALEELEKDLRKIHGVQDGH